MQTAVFVDATAWVSLSAPRDQHQEQARVTWARLQRERPVLVTTNLVIAESHGLIARRAGTAVGLGFLATFATESSTQVIWADSELTGAATDKWLREYRDKTWSLTDAVSFEVMRRRAIREAFAFDEHFEQAGFTLL
ncbi:MAG: PIN domain-containing protein [Gemmatimonadetes bacterium]|nr:PIN domain-containing protein [Gemmatimonadota bacterium]